MKVRYMVEESLKYSGTIEISENEFEEMNSMDDVALGNLIFDISGKNNPTELHPIYIEEFEKV